VDVTVVGSGVIGLTSALRLQEAGFRVRVLAAEPPERTTSAVAAAVWYPYHAFPPERVLAWAARSREVYVQLALEAGSGVSIAAGIDVVRGDGEAWQEAAGGRRCRPEELPPGCPDGWVITVPLVETPIFLPYLLERLRARGAAIESRRVASLAEIDGLVVNCAGLGARELAGDASLVPVRGQVVRVRNPGLERFVVDEHNPDGLTYVVPRSADCVLGGTAEEGDWELEPRAETSEAIVQRCVALEPRLEGAEVLSEAVGLRPGRPEVRLEREGDVIHNYGHGGAGVTLSWGCADDVVALAG
jgi:D-amino-acid oxidase